MKQTSTVSSDVFSLAHWNRNVQGSCSYGAIRVSVAVLTLSLALFVSQKSDAATGPKWTSGGTSGSSEPHTVSRASDMGTEVSPFAPGSNNIAIDLGQVFLMGDLNQYSDSLGTQVHYTYGVSDLFGFDSSLGYSQHSDGKLSMLSALAGMRMNLSWYDKIIPYATFGMGFYRPSYQDPSIPTGLPSSDLSAVLFGVHLGPGIDLELNKNFFFGTALTFHNMFGTSKAMSNGSLMSIGGTYTTFLVHMGTTF